MAAIDVTQESNKSEETTLSVTINNSVVVVKKVVVRGLKTKMFRKRTFLHATSNV